MAAHLSQSILWQTLERAEDEHVLAGHAWWGMMWSWDVHPDLVHTRMYVSVHVTTRIGIPSSYVTMPTAHASSLACEFE